MKLKWPIKKLIYNVSKKKNCMNHHASIKFRVLSPRAIAYFAPRKHSPSRNSRF